MPFQRVEVSVETIEDAFGPKFVTRLVADITAVGNHYCEVAKQ